MDIKMIVTDMDYTLLRDDKTISLYTAEIFRRVRARGILTAFATARPVRNAKNIVDINFDAAIYHNGAVAQIGGREFLRADIDNTNAKAFVLAAEQNFAHLQIAVEMDEVLYTNFDARPVWGIPFTRINLADLPQKPSEKILFVGDVADKIRHLLPPELYVQTSEGVLTMIMHKNASKFSALKAIAAHFAIPLANIAAFGDDYNDLEMLAGCTGVAMENAIDRAKAAAKYICGDCNNDGVARWVAANVL